MKRYRIQWRDLRPGCTGVNVAIVEALNLWQAMSRLAQDLAIHSDMGAAFWELLQVEEISC